MLIHDVNRRQKISHLKQTKQNIFMCQEIIIETPFLVAP
jgi:hypothetical protein